jgi:hypothetical protein
MAAVREFARLWWHGRPRMVEGIVIAALAFAMVVIFLDWPLWAVAVVWLGVQVVAMAVWAGWQMTHDQAEQVPVEGESGG